MLRHIKLQVRGTNVNFLCKCHHNMKLVTNPNNMERLIKTHVPSLDTCSSTPGKCYYDSRTSDNEQPNVGHTLRNLNVKLHNSDI